MKILIGDYELIYSGVVIQVKNYPIKIILPDKVEGDFAFIFNFVDEYNSSFVSSKITLIDKYTLSIDLKNFNSPTISGNSDLIEVGTLHNIPLFLNYRVNNLPNVNKTLTFNFYQRKGGQHAS